MVDAYLLGLMVATLIFNFIMVLYLIVLVHKQKEEISDMYDELSDMYDELSLLQNKIKNLEEEAKNKI